MHHLPTHETRHERYSALVGERFGERPRRVSEGANLLELPIPLCPECLLPIHLCEETRCREVI